MRTLTTRIFITLAITLPAVASSAFAKYTEQWVSDTELSRTHPGAHLATKPKPKAEAKSEAKARAKLKQRELAANDDPIAAFAHLKGPASASSKRVQ